MPTSTPWGISQSSRKIAPGIIFYNTAGHGGVHLAKKRQEQMKSKFPNFQTWLKTIEWFEEDADLIVVILAWTEYFEPQTVKKAFDYAKKDNYFAKCRESQYWSELSQKYDNVP